MSVIDTSSKVTAGIETLKSHGVTTVGRYYSSSSWKRLTKPEAEAICSGGMDIFTVFENGGDPLLTEDSGIHDAMIAKGQAEGIGQPKGSAIYFALEHLPNGYDTKHVPGVKKYMKGVKSVLNGHYAVGAYSDGVICRALLDAGLVDYTWLSASSSFPGTHEFYDSGDWSLAQRKVDLDWDGLSIDTNKAKAEFGGFSVATSMGARAMTVTGDAGAIPTLIKIGSDPASIEEVQALAAKTMSSIHIKYPKKSCAATLSHFLRKAGIGVPITTGAQNLADRIHFNRGWAKVKVGKQQAGDVGVCFSLADDVPGADHIYLVVDAVDNDLMVIADNQFQGATHSRYASGKGGKTPTEYFLRAQATSGKSIATRRLVGDDVWPDENTNDLPEPFMDDGTARFEAAIDSD